MCNCECASILLSTEGDSCPSGCSKSSECSAAVGGGVVGGFVGGVLMTAVVAAVIFVVFAQRMRSVHMRIFVAHYYWSCFSWYRAKVDGHGSSSEVAKEQKGYIPSRGNLAYGQVKREGVGDSEYEMCDMPSGAAMATQESTYETVPT